MKDRLRTLFRDSTKGRKLRPATIADVSDLMDKGLQRKLEKSPRMLERLSSAEGLFSALAVVFGPDAPAPAPCALLELSGALDQMGVAFAKAAEEKNFAGAQNALLEAEGLGAVYWAAPELCLLDAEANRSTVRGANNWAQLTRAAAPLIFNGSFSWLSLLDIATLSVGKYAGADFPLFLPLITQPSDTRLSPDVFEADRRRLPVANLIRMVEVLAEEIRETQRRHLKPSERNSGKAPSLFCGRENSRS